MKHDTMFTLSGMRKLQEVGHLLISVWLISLGCRKKGGELSFSAEAGTTINKLLAQVALVLLITVTHVHVCMQTQHTQHVVVPSDFRDGPPSRDLEEEEVPSSRRSPQAPPPHCSTHLLRAELSPILRPLPQGTAK